MIPHPQRLTLKIVRQLADARDYSESQRFRSGYEFLDETAMVMRRVCATPLAFPTARGELRRAIVRRFRFKVVFVIRSDHVLFIAAYHGARGPRNSI